MTVTNKRFKVVFKRKGEKDIIVGDAYIIEAKNERQARKETRELLRARFFGTPPKIAWVDEI